MIMFNYNYDNGGLYTSKCVLTEQGYYRRNFLFFKWIGLLRVEKKINDI